MVGAIAVFLTAVTAVALEHQRHQSTEDRMTAGQVGLALFSVFQVLTVYLVCGQHFEIL